MKPIRKILFLLILPIVLFFTGYAIGYNREFWKSERRDLYGRMLVANAIYIDNQSIDSGNAEKCGFNRELAAHWMIAILHEIEQCGVEQVALLGKDSGTEHNFREAIKRATNLRNKQVSFIDTDQGQNFEAKAIGKMKKSNDAIFFSKYCVLPKRAILVISLIGVVVSILAVVGLLLENR